MPAREDTRQACHAEALPREVALEHVDVPLVELDRPFVLGELELCLSEVKVCGDENA